MSTIDPSSFRKLVDDLMPDILDLAREGMSPEDTKIVELAWNRWMWRHEKILASLNYDCGTASGNQWAKGAISYMAEKFYRSCPGTGTQITMRSE